MRSKKEYGRISNVHQWLRRHYGRADVCENVDCRGKSTIFDYALVTGKKYERKRENFRRLCRSCHRSYDNASGVNAAQVAALRANSAKNGKKARALTMEQAEEIRNHPDNRGQTYAALGRKYGVSYPTIRSILQRKTYLS